MNLPSLGWGNEELSVFFCSFRPRKTRSTSSLLTLWKNVRYRTVLNGFPLTGGPAWCCALPSTAPVGQQWAPPTDDDSRILRQRKGQEEVDDKEKKVRGELGLVKKYEKNGVWVGGGGYQ